MKNDSASASPLRAGDSYFENGFIVLTEQYHLRRGFCCGNRCRHCPYGHEAVPDAGERD